MHSKQVVAVLERFAEHPCRLGDMEGEFFATQHWNETIAQEDFTIVRDNDFAKSAGEWIISGPHFFVANPLFQTPKRICNTHRAYDVIDLNHIPDDYLPRTLYRPACSPEDYYRRTPRVSWGEERRVTELYRIKCSRGLSQSGERTLQPSVMIRESGHIDGVFTVAPKASLDVVRIAGLWASVPVDFFVKSTGKGDLRHDLARQLPVLLPEAAHQLTLRTLILNCLTTQYADLWVECWDDAFHEDYWTKDDPRLDPDRFRNLTPTWQRNCALRTDFERRQALLEIDILASMALGLTLEELQTIYRVQFPVMRHYDRHTYYDQSGRIIYTNSRGLTGVGFSTTEWQKIKDKKSGTVEKSIRDDTLPGGPVERTIVYHAPFTGVNREADYEQAWDHFQERFATAVPAISADHST